MFPRDETASLCGFEARNLKTNKKVTGIVKEKEEAQNKYSDSIAEGKAAYLLEEEDRNFKASVGLLAPLVRFRWT